MCPALDCDFINSNSLRIIGYLWVSCGPGMPGPYRVAMRKPDVALRLAGRMYAAPTIAGRFTTRNVGGGVAGL